MADHSRLGVLAAIGVAPRSTSSPSLSRTRQRVCWQASRAFIVTA